MIRPERALEGTVTSSPMLVLRRRAPGDLRLMRAPGEEGKATTNPLFNPTPASSSVPRVDTWRGFVPHLDTGTHRTLVMRTLRTCGLALGVPIGAPPPEALLGAPPGGAVPPELAAMASRGWAAISSASSPARTTARDVHRLCARVLATFIPSRRTDCCLRRRTGALSARSDLSGYGVQT
jgi:hypothetical protein